MVRYFWTKFITDERLITSRGALTFLNEPTMSIKRQAGGLPRQFASDVLPVGSIYSVTPDVC
jgi:hypothetical protein